MATRLGTPLAVAGGGAAAYNYATRETPSASQRQYSNLIAYRDLESEANSKIDEAYRTGDMDGAERLQRQLDNQTYDGTASSWNPRSWRMGGWNPFAANNMADYAEKVRGDAPNQDRYDAMKSRLEARRGQMSASEVGNYERSLENMRMRLNIANSVPNIQRNMLNTKSAGGLGTPASHWQAGYRYHPGYPAYPGYPCLS